jgi:fructose-1,6-bisphosphatase/inositol monophosphatase family enzyme
MRVRQNRLATWGVALALATSGTACAAAAAAGAAGAIYATTRGVESLVAGSIDRVAARSQQVMKDMGIAQVGESSNDAGAKREFKGKHADLDVTIQLQQQDTATTKVEVYARKNLAEWDKDYARSVLERIVKQ